MALLAPLWLRARYFYLSGNCISTMPSNRGMIMLAQKVGFEIDIQMEDGIVCSSG